MKKIITSIIILLTVTAVNAQNPKLPKDAGKLPLPDLKPLEPADLVITDISYLSGEKNIKTGKYYVRLRMSIKNYGQIRTGAFKLHAYYERTVTSGAGAVWTGFGIPSPIANINPGQTITRDFVFERDLSGLGRGTYSVPFYVLVDFLNEVRESNEDNNNSAHINIQLVLGTD